MEDWSSPVLEVSSPTRSSLANKVRASGAVANASNYGSGDSRSELFFFFFFLGAGENAFSRGLAQHPQSGLHTPELTAAKFSF